MRTTDKSWPTQQMKSLLQRIATGPELSKDISREEARLGMISVLDGLVHPVQAGLYLIALRMKRESDDEILGIQQALIEETSQIDVGVDQLVDIVDPFNGYNRGLPMSPFLPAVLAACGVPAVSQGVKSVGPKYGVTHSQILAQSGELVAMDMSEAAARVADPSIGWAYLDQSVSAPKLYGLIELRDLMVKRTCLTTIEVALRPLHARQRNHLVTGYVHKPYPPVYTRLAREAGYHSALIIRGVEGGVVPSMQQPSRATHYVDINPDKEWRFHPELAGIIEAPNRAVPLPGVRDSGDEVDFDVGNLASAAAVLGLEALNGKPGLPYDSLVYAGSLILSHLGRGSIPDCADQVRNVLNKGLVIARMGR